MKYKAFTILSVLFLSLNAFAVQVDQCPKTISFSAKVERVVKNSIYSAVPGWKEAQATLAKTESFRTTFKLTEKKKQICFYVDRKFNKARLSTAAFQDPEEYNPSLVDHLVVNFVIDKSHYVTYLPLLNIDIAGIKMYSNPFRLKIKTQLLSGHANRVEDFDLGMISVSAQ